MTDRPADRDGKLLSLHPTDTYWLGRARRTTGPKRLAEKALFYRKALEALPSEMTRLELAETYYRMQCYDAADALILEVLDQDPSAGQAWYLLGLTALARGDEITSQNAFDRCMRLSPLSQAAVNAQSMLLDYAWSRGERIPTLGFRSDCLLRKARKKEPGPERTALCVRACLRHPGPRALLALVAEEAREYPAFCLALLPYVYKNRALRLDACLYGAVCLSRLGRNPLPCLYAASLSAASAGDVERLTKAALEAGQTDFILAHLDNLLREAPFSSGLMLLKARCLEKKGAFGEAGALRAAAEHAAPEGAQARDCAGELKRMAVYHSRLRRGQLNRLLHRLAVFRADLDPAALYRIAVPLYRGMNRDARRNMEKTSFRPWDTAFALCVALRTGRPEAAPSLPEGRRRFILRQVRRVDRELYRLAGSLPAAKGARGRGLS